jgi:hypothetical protein
MVEVIETDVLVIGGGASGTNAVLKAADRGARTALVVKGLVGKSGCSIFASTIPFGTPTRHWVVEDVSPEERDRGFGAKNVQLYGPMLEPYRFRKRSAGAPEELPTALPEPDR